jgi:hypothetical protein
MGCFLALLALISPRLVLVVLWIFSDVLSRAFSSWIIPFLGFFLLPWTTLTYAAFWDWGSGRHVVGFEWFCVALAFFIDRLVRTGAACPVRLRFAPLAFNNESSRPGDSVPDVTCAHGLSEGRPGDAAPRRDTRHVHGLRLRRGAWPARHAGSLTATKLDRCGRRTGIRCWTSARCRSGRLLGARAVLFLGVRGSGVRGIPIAAAWRTNR